MTKIEKIEGVYVCKELNIWEMSKRQYIATLEILIGGKSNRANILDEINTILRGNKIKKSSV